MHELDEIMSWVVGIVASSLALSIPIVYIVLRYRGTRRAMDLLHTERMAAIERGMELPLPASDLLGDQSSIGKPRTALLPGLMWLFVGLAIVGARFSAELESPPLFVGLVPVGIGLAYLLYYYLEERKTIQTR